MKHRISLFKGARDNVPKGAELEWSKIAQVLTTHEFVPPTDKLECDAWSPAIYPPDVTRAGVNVQAFHVWTGDYDGVPFEAFTLTMQCVVDQGWACAMHSSWRQAIDPYRFRVVLPLSRPVTPEEWPELWEALNDALGGYADPHCKDPSHLYFGAYAPLGDEDEAFSKVIEGTPVDVDQLLGTPPEKKGAPSSGGIKDRAPQGTTVTRDQIERYAKALTRKRDDHEQYLGATLLKVVKGVTFADPGNIDNTVFLMSAILAERFPEDAAESMAEHFEQSLALMADHNPAYAMTVDQVQAKIEWCQAKNEEERLANESEAQVARRQQIKDAFGDGRETPYTPEELVTVPPQRWVIQHGRSYYSLVKDAYKGPYTQDEAQSAITRDLSPAHTAGVELFTSTPSGEIHPKSLGKLVRSYGFVCDDVAVDLSATRARFDESSRTLIEAPCPVRKVTPRYHEVIAKWLAALAGERLHLLQSWIAAVTNLSVPCTALFLTGHKHTGKSVLPEGLSRLWTALGYPTPLEDVLGTNFNEAQLRCPLCFADERLPTDFRGRVLNSELRHFIQSRRRSLRRKFLPNSEMIGAVRLVISANNEEILATNENLSNHDIGAIVDRYLHIPCSIEAYHYLQDGVDTSGWVDRDVIAEHALWLRDNHVWKPNGRFLVHGNDEALHSRLISSTGIRSALLQFCVAYLFNPEPLQASSYGQLMVRTHDGKLYVNVQGVIVCWSQYVTNEACPATGVLGRAISALSEDGRPRLNTPRKGRVNYRVIKTEHLIAWAVDKDYATADQILDALKKSTEEVNKRLAPN